MLTFQNVSGSINYVVLLSDHRERPQNGRVQCWRKLLAFLVFFLIFRVVFNVRSFVALYGFRISIIVELDSLLDYTSGRRSLSAYEHEGTVQASRTS